MSGDIRTVALLDLDLLTGVGADVVPSRKLTIIELRTSFDSVDQFSHEKGIQVKKMTSAQLEHPELFFILNLTTTKKYTISAC